MPPFKDLGDMIFGRLTALYPLCLIKNHRIAWWCYCECGNELIVGSYELRMGLTKSCKCLKRERTIEAHTTHGMTGSPEYLSWDAMVQRVTNPKNKKHKRYGGRGIDIDPRWLKFENFYADMGPKPTSKHTIERKDSSKGYWKWNCRWATYAEQNRNHSRNVWLTANEITLIKQDWADILGCTMAGIDWHLKNDKSMQWIADHFKEKQNAQ